MCAHGGQKLSLGIFLYQYPPLKKIICLFIYLLVYVTICGRVYVCRRFHMCNGGRVDGKDNFQEQILSFHCVDPMDDPRLSGGKRPSLLRVSP